MDTGTIVYVDYDLFNADNDELIETTREETAKKHDQHEESRTYEPLCYPHLTLPKKRKV